MAITIPGLAIKVDGDTSGLESALNGLNQKLNQSIGAQVTTAIATSATAAFMVFEKGLQAVGAGANLATAAFGRFMDAASRLGDIEDAAFKLEIDPNDLLSIKRGAKITGANEDALIGAFDDIQKKLGAAMSGGADPFAALGMSLSQLAVLDPVSQLGAIADRLNEIADPALRQKLGEDVFGKQFRQLDLLLSSGSGGLEKFREEFDALGLTIDDAMLKRLGDAEDKMNDVSAQATTIGDKLISGISPAIEAIADVTSYWLASFEEGSMDRWIARLMAASRAFGVGLNILSSNVVGMIKTLDMAIERITGMKLFADGGAGFAAALPGGFGDYFAQIEQGAIEIEKEMKAEREASREKRAREKEMTQSERARAQLERIGGNLMKDVGTLGGAFSDWWTGGGGAAGGDKAGRQGSPQYAGALEMGTAAAYSAAYRVDQNAPDKEIAKNTAKSTSLLDKATGYLGDLVKKMPTLGPARAT